MIVKVIFFIIIVHPDAGIVHVVVVIVIIRPSASRAKELSRARAEEAFNRVLHSMRARARREVVSFFQKFENFSHFFLRQTDG